jgi:peptidoglycan/xylan/chitin deacetylase (PgdA/CDA1 family)
MKNSDKTLLIHVDVDSPLALMRFYGISGINYSSKELETFYFKSWERIMDFFHRKNIKATFFLVGEELEHSDSIKKIIKQAHALGHEIENHTYSHPFGLARLSDEEIKNEIVKCNKIINDITGCAPIGFRSPGYNINTNSINIIEDLGFKYDSSGFWSLMNTVLKSTHKLFFKNGLKNADFGDSSKKLLQQAYRPHREDWLKSTSDRKFLELPLPRTSFFNLPFYNNFNLFTPALYSNFISKTINKPFIIYLFHIIEFMDLSDGIPLELSIHPNVKIAAKEKIKRSETILTNLLSRYRFLKTAEFVETSLNII